MVDPPNEPGVDTPKICYAIPDSDNTRGLVTRMWEYAQDFGPQIVIPSEGFVNFYEADPEGAIPTFQQSVNALTRIAPPEPLFQDVCSSCKFMHFFQRLALTRSSPRCNFLDSYFLRLCSNSGFNRKMAIPKIQHIDRVKICDACHSSLVPIRLRKVNDDFFVARLR